MRRAASTLELAGLGGNGWDRSILPGYGRRHHRPEPWPQLWGYPTC
ncbi:hypothetical protein IQ241_17835 [Romeria aff. gracilis LEGE 07310]|uniref:Uncharacterized protein n=1 Tax=Vasconcelosia minhoensis LEGE 07310 TaxID=915328 RepID=A0A8J7AZA9_9CYAN|nr:hypothetical protein [Romeria gracilis]MBE9079137.1 hypothetical protein [Romeria aff. gracilis LEGE 07310]